MSVRILKVTPSGLYTLKCRSKACNSDETRDDSIKQLSYLFHCILHEKDMQGGGLYAKLFMLSSLPAAYEPPKVAQLLFLPCSLLFAVLPTTHNIFNVFYSCNIPLSSFHTPQGTRSLPDVDFANENSLHIMQKPTEQPLLQEITGKNLVS